MNTEGKYHSHCESASLDLELCLTFGVMDISKMSHKHQTSLVYNGHKAPARQTALA